MAVYTHITNSELTDLLAHYTIGKAKNLKGIEQGVENSNYFLTTEQNKYILTIYEERINHDDLPFYLHLMQHLAAADIPCPVPIKTNNNQMLSQVHNSPCAIVSFLNGKSVQAIKNDHLEELGTHMARMHLAGENFNEKLPNNYSIDKWFELFKQVKDRADDFKPGLKNEIATALGKIKQSWPTNLPQGIIHGDLFPDNVFFANRKLVGIIDFYFASYDAIIYELAICLNAWCFENNHEFNITKAKLLLRAYNKVRPISDVELEALPTLSAGAAMRFLLTRLYDWLNQKEDALVKPHDPREYLHKLRFHTNVKSHHEYGL